MMSEDLEINEVCEECEIHYSDEAADEQTEDEFAEENPSDIPIFDEGEPARKWALKGRLKSPVLWASAIAQLALIADCVYGIACNGWDVSLGEKIGLCVISILTIFGILNSPVDTDAF